MDHPCTLYNSSKDKATVRCEGKNTRTGERCSNKVHGYEPASCMSHRDNKTPIIGWAWISAAEAAAISILRANNCVDQHLAALRELDAIQALRTIDEGVNRLHITPTRFGYASEHARAYARGMARGHARIEDATDEDAGDDESKESVESIDPRAAGLDPVALDHMIGEVGEVVQPGDDVVGIAIELLREDAGFDEL